MEVRFRYGSLAFPSVAFDDKVTFDTIYKNSSTLPKLPSFVSLPSPSYHVLVFGHPTATLTSIPPIFPSHSAAPKRYCSSKMENVEERLVRLEEEVAFQGKEQNASTGKSTDHAPLLFSLHRFILL